MAPSEKLASTSSIPPESAFVPLTEGTPFGVICVVRTRDGRYLGSEVGVGQWSQRTLTNQQKIFVGEYGPHALWRFKPGTELTEWSSQQWFPSLENRATVRFEHIVTTRNLHSHQSLALSDYGCEVTGYGNFGRGDENDNWTLNISQSSFVISHIVNKGFLAAKSSSTSSPQRDEEVYAIAPDQLFKNQELWAAGWDIRFLPVSLATPFVTLFAAESAEQIVPLLKSSDDKLLEAGTLPSLQVGFDTLPALKAFLQEERTKWDFVRWPYIREYSDLLFDAILQRLDAINSSFASRTSHELRQLTLACLDDNVTSTRWTWSWLFPGKQILESLPSLPHPLTAWMAIGITLKLPGLVQHFSDLEDVAYYTNAYFFLQDLQNRENSPQTKQESLSNELQGAVLSAHEQIRDLRRLVLRGRKRINRSLGTALSKSIQTVAAFGELIDGGKRELDGLKNSYQEAIKASSIEKDLSSKSEEHRSLFRLFLLLALVVGSGSFVGIIQVIFPAEMTQVKLDENAKLQAILSAKDDTVQKAIAACLGHSEWFAYLEVGILITLALYILRLLVKLAMSQFHQWQDTQERLVLLRTYYTILEIVAKKGDKFTDAERAIVIGSIYRSGTVGVVKDEHGASLNITELIAKALEK